MNEKEEKNAGYQRPKLPGKLQITGIWSFGLDSQLRKSRTG
jgi:hypothetical protein